MNANAVSTRSVDRPRHTFLVGLCALLALPFGALHCALAVEPASNQSAGKVAAFEELPNPQELVRLATERLLAAVQRNQEAVYNDPRLGYALVEKFASPHVDYERISRSVLGQHWRRASGDQRERFVSEFRTLLVRTYATAVARFAGAKIIYLPSSMARNGRAATVRSQIPQRSGPPISVDYRLHLKEDGWKVYDLLVEGVSLVLTHRISIKEQASKLGLDGLIERLAAKNLESGAT